MEYLILTLVSAAIAAITVKAREPVLEPVLVKKQPRPIEQDT